MNKYKQRKGNLYDPKSKTPFRLSRSKIDMFLKCPRCFYLDRRMGLGRPGMPGFSLNSAVDALLKNEFDLLRKKGQKHELMKKYKIDAIPFTHPDLPIWRDDIYHYKGASFIHKPTNLEICGIIDDVWINKKKELIIVDYKSTSTSKEISLEDEYKQGYKKQMEVYQWKNRDKFDARLEFELQIISYKGDISWVEPTIFEMKKCLDLDKIPDADPECEYCMYRKLIGDKEK